MKRIILRIHHNCATGILEVDVTILKAYEFGRDTIYEFSR